MKPGRPASSNWLLILPGLVLTLLLGLPVAALLLQGLDGELLARLGQAQALAALRLSLSTSAVSTMLAVIVGTPLAYILARWKLRGRALIELIVDLPLVLPPSVAGLALLLAFGRRGLLGESLLAYGISLPFSTLAVVLAQLFVAAPLFVRSARLGFMSVDKQLEESAITEGATHWQLFRYVMVPTAGTSLIGGALLCLARALGEFGATLLFAGNLMGRTQTMPLAIYVGLESDRGVAIALSLILLAVSALLLALLRNLERNWSLG
ncbi:MAG TPA: ABC transporter permease [Anaerolineales bacterium]|nr:ABC transporter permease [Anaerolineales bacterium]HRQ92146.1 ABC transporter permease [Anaerolineales bacterium]